MLLRNRQAPAELLPRHNIAEGGTTVLARLEALDLRGRSKAAREAYRELLVYFRNQVDRMDALKAWG